MRPVLIRVQTVVDRGVIAWGIVALALWMVSGLAVALVLKYQP